MTDLQLLGCTFVLGIQSTDSYCLTYMCTPAWQTLLLPLTLPVTYCSRYCLRQASNILREWVLVFAVADCHSKYSNGILLVAMAILAFSSGISDYFCCLWCWSFTSPLIPCSFLSSLIYCCTLYCNNNN